MQEERIAGVVSLDQQIAALEGALAEVGQAMAELSRQTRERSAILRERWMQIHAHLCELRRRKATDVESY